MNGYPPTRGVSFCVLTPVSELFMEPPLSTHFCANFADLLFALHQICAREYVPAITTCVSRNKARRALDNSQRGSS